MATVHEVVAQDGTCLYRGRDVELACELYAAAPAGSHLLRRQIWTADDEVGHGASATDAPIPYALTVAGYAATRRASTVDASADLFVVDTTDVGELRRRCPELFAPRTGGAA
jgi:hypothetical protein